ncbi:MAG: hypothetical protein J6B53_02205 [Clostridia bacterium]|nr:hypothetical protein [Clostridia bacterium]
MMKRSLHVFLFMFMLLCGLCSGIRKADSEGIVSEVEIKLLLDGDRMLDADHLLKKEFREAFQMKKQGETYLVAYLETPDMDYMNAGWVNRIRAKSGKKKITLTHKKRVEIRNGDIEAALKIAAEELPGMETLLNPDRETAVNGSADMSEDGESPFVIEVDWGYERMTLNLTHETDVRTESKVDELPERNEAVQMIARSMPDAEKDAVYPGWGTEKLETAQLAGPIRFLRYKGKMNESEIRIEIWPVQEENETAYIVEFSAECEEWAEAERVRKEAIDCLDEMGILLHTDALKTQMILKNGA